MERNEAHETALKDYRTARSAYLALLYRNFFVAENEGSQKDIVTGKFYLNERNEILFIEHFVLAYIKRTAKEDGVTGIKESEIRQLIPSVVVPCFIAVRYGEKQTRRINVL